jgi:TolB-like protein/DNA-binding winged helix-turn-helix (wHTH) protein
VSTPVSERTKAGSADLRVGPWRVDRARNEVSSEGKSMRLEPKAIEVLAYLASRPGEVVPREELLAAVWPGVVVGDDALTQAIIKLRKALGDDAHEPKYIETISKRGYRLIAPPAAPAAGKPARPPSRKRWIAAVALVLLGAAGGFVAVRSARMPWPLHLEGKPAAAAFPTVAVLPLANLSGDPARDYWSEGLTEDLINGLGRFSGVRVMSRNAVQAFKGTNRTPQAIGADLAARYIVQGTVRESQGTTRITLQVAETEKGALLASHQYDAEGPQLLEMQERMVRQIVGALHVKLTEIEQRRAMSRPTQSLEAYDLLLQARALLARTTRDSNRRARELLVQAQKVAPDYAELSVALGEAELQRVIYGWVEDAEGGLGRAIEHTRHALSLPDTGAHSRAYVVVSTIEQVRDRNEEALVNAERALELNPSDTRALARRGSALTWIGRIDEAIPTLETCRRLEPNAPAAQLTPLPIAYYTAGRYADALAEANRLVGLYPHVGDLHAIRAATLAQLGREEEAREAGRRLRRLNPLFSVEQWGTRFRSPEHAENLRQGLRKAGL